MKFTTSPHGSRDVQLVFAFKKGKRDYCEVIAVFLVSRKQFMKIARNEKIRVLVDEGINEIEDKRLYQALTKEIEAMSISLEEYIEF